MRPVFCWHDLLCADPDGISQFYTKIFGWEARDGRLYAGGAAFAAVQPLEPESGWPAHWLPVLALPAWKEAVGRAMAEDGHVLALGPGFAVIADAGGAALTLVDSADPAAAAAPSPILWDELLLERAEEAGFWVRVLGCTARAADMGALGAGMIFCHGRGPGAEFASALPSPLAPPGRWVPYIGAPQVAGALEDIAARVQAAGGRRLIGPVALPDGSGVLLCADPEGAMFGVMS